MSSPHRKGKKFGTKKRDNDREADGGSDSDRKSPFGGQGGLEFGESSGSGVFGDHESDDRPAPIPRKGKKKPFESTWQDKEPSDRNSFVDVDSPKDSGRISPPSAPKNRKGAPKKAGKVIESPEVQGKAKKRGWRDDSPASSGREEAEAWGIEQRDQARRPNKRQANERSPQQTREPEERGFDDENPNKNNIFSSTSKRDRLANPDRSKSTAKVFRKLGDQPGPSLTQSGTFQEDAYQLGAKKRAVSRIITGTRGRETDETARSNVLDLLKLPAGKGVERSPRQADEEPPSEDTLGKKLRQILEGNGPKSPQNFRQAREARKKELEEEPERTTPRRPDRSPPKSPSLPLDESLKLDEVKPEDRFAEIRNRVLQQRAKSRHVAPRSFPQKEELFQKESTDFIELPHSGGSPRDPQIHRSFLKDYRHSDLPSLGFRGEELGEVLENRVSERREPPSSRVDTEGYEESEAVEGNNYQSLRDKRKQLRSEAAMEKEGRRATDQSLEGEESQRKGHPGDKGKSLIKRSSIEESHPKSSPIVKRLSEDGPEWNEINQEKPRYSELKKKGRHLVNESIDLTENLLGGTQRLTAGREESAEEKSPLHRTPSHRRSEEESNRLDHLLSPPRVSQAKHGGSKEPISPRQSDEAALDSGIRHPNPEFGKRRRTNLAQNLPLGDNQELQRSLLPGNEASQPGEEAQDHPKLTHDSSDRPLKAPGKAGYNLDDPGFEDTYVPSGKAGKRNLNKSGRNPTAEGGDEPKPVETSTRRSMLPKKLSSEDHSPVLPPMILSQPPADEAERTPQKMGSAKVTGQKSMSASEAKEVPVSTFVNAAFELPITPANQEPKKEPVGEAEQLIIDFSGPKTTGPRRPIGIKPPKRVKPGEEEQPAVEAQATESKGEAVEVGVEPPKARPPLGRFAANRIKAKAEPEIEIKDEPANVPTEETVNVGEAPKKPVPARPMAEAKETVEESPLAQPKKEEPAKFAAADDLVQVIEPPKRGGPKGRFGQPPKEEVAVPEAGTEAVPKTDEGLTSDVQPPKRPPLRSRIAAAAKEEPKEPTEGPKEVVVSAPAPPAFADATAAKKDVPSPVASATLPPNDAPAAPTEAPPAKPAEEEKAEDPNSLAVKLKSANFKIRQEAYGELLAWSSTEITPEVFAKNLHNYIKDKHPVSLESLLTAADNFLDVHPKLFALVDFKALIENIADHLLSNVKGVSKEKALDFIVRLWEMSTPEVFLEQLLALLTSAKPKRQEACLTMAMELVRNHKVLEMKSLKSLWPEINKLVGSRTVSLKNQTMELYKEVYLWIQEALKPFITDLKKPQMDELENYFKGLDSSKFKKVEKKVRVPKAVPGALQASATNPLGGSKGGEGAKDGPSADDATKTFNNQAWVDSVLAVKTAKEQAAKIEEATDKFSKQEQVGSTTNWEPLFGLIKKVLGLPSAESKVAAAHLLQVLAGKLGKALGAPAKEFFKLMFPKLADKATADPFLAALTHISASLALDDVLVNLKEHLDSKKPDLILPTLVYIKGCLEKEERLADPDRGFRLAELSVKFSEEKNTDIKNVAHQILGSQLMANEAKMQPLLKALSPASLNVVNQIATSIKRNTRAALLKDDLPESGDPKAARANAKSNVQRIAQIREDALGNKIIKTSDAKQFPAHLLKNLNFLVEATGDFRNLFADEAAEVQGFIESLLKLDKLVLTEPMRLILLQFFIEQSNNAHSEQLQAVFDQFYALVLKSATNKVFLEGLLGLLLKKHLRLGKDFFHVLVGLLDKEIGLQAALAGVPLKQFTDFLKIEFGEDGIQIVFKKLLTNTMRLLMRKFGDQSVADFPPVLLHEFDAINEAQKVFEKIIEKLNDRNPERRKAALIDLANYSDPSTILTFWSNDKFVSFLKRQITIETKSSNYLVLIKILDHYLDIRTISFADFNIKTFIFIFHAVLMNFYDRKDDPHVREIEALIKKAVAVLTPTVIINEMIAADNAALSWKEQILHFLHEHSADVEPSLKILNYLVQLLGQKSSPREFLDLLTKIFLRYKHSPDPEILAKGNEVKAIREIWAKNEEDLVVNADFIRGTDLFEKPELLKAAREYLGRSLKLDEKQFYCRNISFLDFKGSEASFKTKMAFWFIRSVENDFRNNNFIINQIFAKSAFEGDEVALSLAIKIALQVLKNQHYDSATECVSLTLALVQQIVRDVGEQGIQRIIELLDLDDLDYDFFNSILMIAEAHHTNQGYGGAAGAGYRSEMPGRNLGNTREIAPGYNTQAPPSRGAVRDNGREFDYESELPSAQKLPPMGPGGERGSADLKNNASVLNTQTYNQMRPAVDQGVLESEMRLQEMFNMMRTFQLEEFEVASNYFKELCASKRAASLNFLLKNRDEIIDNFLEVCQTIFNEGINYDLKKTDYELIFGPLIKLFEKENFLLSMTREKTLSLCEFLINQFISANEEKKVADPSDPEVMETAEYIFKVWNALLLRVTDHAHPNYALYALFYLVYNVPRQQRSRVVEAEVNLALRCIVRISKNMSKHIASLDGAVVLDCINKYLAVFGAQADEFSTKVVKNLLTDFVNLSDADSVLETYRIMYGSQEDSVLLKWILAIRSDGNDNSRIERAPRATADDGPDLLVQLINDLNKQSGTVPLKTYFARFQKLLAQFPDLRLRSYEDYFASKDHFSQVVKAMGYYAAVNTADPRQGGSLTNTRTSNARTSEPKTLQAVPVTLTAGKGARPARKPESRVRERPNYNDISEMRDND